MMDIRSSLRMLAFSNLLHGIAALVIAYFVSEPDVSPQTNTGVFLVVITILMVDWSVNIRFFTDTIKLYSNDMVLKVSTTGFGILSLLLRLETSSTIILNDFIFFTIDTVHFLLLSTVFFGINLLLLARKPIAETYQSHILIIGIIHLALALPMIVGQQLGEMGLGFGLANSVFFPNYIKYLVMPFVSGYIFYRWSSTVNL